MKHEFTAIFGAMAVISNARVVPTPSGRILRLVEWRRSRASESPSGNWLAVAAWRTVEQRPS